MATIFIFFSSISLLLFIHYIFTRYSPSLSLPSSIPSIYSYYSLLPLNTFFKNSFVEKKKIIIHVSLFNTFCSSFISYLTIFPSSLHITHLLLFIFSYFLSLFCCHITLFFLKKNEDVTSCFEFLFLFTIFYGLSCFFFFLSIDYF